MKNILLIIALSLFSLISPDTSDADISGRFRYVSPPRFNIAAPRVRASRPARRSTAAARSFNPFSGSSRSYENAYSRELSRRNRLADQRYQRRVAFLKAEYDLFKKRSKERFARFINRKKAREQALRIAAEKRRIEFLQGQNTSVQQQTNVRGQRVLVRRKRSLASAFKRALFHW